MVPEGTCFPAGKADTEETVKGFKGKEGKEVQVVQVVKGKIGETSEEVAMGPGKTIPVLMSDGNQETTEDGREEARKAWAVYRVNATSDPDDSEVGAEACMISAGETRRI